MPETEVRVSDVRAFETKSGNTRFVLVDDEGKEYSTFEDQIASRLAGLQGKRGRIKFHEQDRDGFRNVYLVAVEPIDEPQEAGRADDTDEVAWRTTVEARYVVAAHAGERELSPRDLFQKLQPFKELVAEDIETSGNR
jgi:hypothetical protein